MTVPRLAHFVFGLLEQTEPFHPMHYLALESCRRVLQPALRQDRKRRTLQYRCT